jgi:hypothetical protein
MNLEKSSKFQISAELSLVGYQLFEVRGLRSEHGKKR